MAISKKLRFEVFKRDSFTCQYCGRSAPDVVLNVDHIHPRSKDGKDDIVNLVTSCVDCNAGKSDRVLSDDTVVKKRKAQLDLLQERREQLDMVMDWQRGLGSIEDNALEQLADYWGDLVPGYSLNEQGLLGLKKSLKRFTIPELAEAMRTAVAQYCEYGVTDESKFTQESVELALKKASGIATINKLSKDKPYLRELYYIRGILRKRLTYCDDHLSIKLLEDAVLRGAPIEDLKEMACTVYNWTAFKDQVTQIPGEM